MSGRPRRISPASHAHAPSPAHEAGNAPAPGEADYQLRAVAPCCDYGVITSVITSGGVAA